MQDRGNLVLCSFGDRIPIRLGMPSNRVGTLYAYGRDEWRPVGPFAVGEWQAVTITFGPQSFEVRIGNAPPKTFPNPLPVMNPRLYLGDGYDVDYVRSNAGSKFLIDLASVRTRGL